MLPHLCIPFIEPNIYLQRDCARLLQHLRYIRYLKNAEGLAQLFQELRGRMLTILGLP